MPTACAASLVSARVRRPSRCRPLTAACIAAALVALASAPARAQNCASASGSNFNGTPIAGGSFIWFNAVVKVRGIDVNAATTLGFSDSTIAFTAGGTSYLLNVPDGVIVFSPAVTEATTSFDGVAWNTVVPASFGKDIFLSGLAFQVPAGGFAGGINPVTWSGSFTSSTSGVTVEWKWAAAVYSQFSSDGSTLGVKPVDGGSENPYANSDHAGTPEDFKPYVTGGARGGGGSNWTGSYSGTVESVACTVVIE